MDLERTKLQKAILLILLVMAVVFAVLTGVVRTKKGVTFEDGLLSISREGERTVYSGRAEGQKVTVTVYPDGEAQVVELAVGTLIDHIYRVEYPGGTIESPLGEYRRIRITVKGKTFLEETLFEGGYNPHASFAYAAFCNANGDSDLLAYSRFVTSSGIWHDYELMPSQVVRFAHGPSTTCRGDWLIYALGVFLSLITAVAAAFPEHLFHWNHFLSVRDPEPTDFYMDCQRVSWVIVTAVVLGVYIWGVTHIVS